jgi:hypothetical protein
MSAEDLPDEPWIAKPLQAIKGRGAVSNLPGRFETQRIDAVDDGWTPFEDDTHITPRLTTSVTPELAKTILSRNQSPDLPFSVSLNPYRVITPCF